MKTALHKKILSLIQSATRLTAREFNALALEIFTHQLARNAPYRKFCRGKKVPHWRDIPAVPTTAFKETTLTTIPSRARGTEFRSSGTTAQQQSRHFHSSRTLEIYEASVLAGFQHFLGREKVLRLQILTPSPREAPHSSLVHMMEALRQKYGGDYFVRRGKVRAEALTLALSRAAGEGISVALLGTALALAEFFDFLATKKLRLKLSRGTWALETGGFKGRRHEITRADLYAQFEEWLGLKRAQIVSEYGMCELSSQFYANEGGVFHGPAWARIMVIDPETGKEVNDGKRGLIRVFDLANVGSTLAVQTEDVGVRRGNGFELVGRAPMAEARGCSLMMKDQG